jgi:enoyl-CoA hydratase
VSVDVQFSEYAATVTMRWPERRNALGPEDVVEVAEALEAAARGGRSAVVLTGEGAFCAGGDLRGFSRLSQEESVDHIRDVVYGRVQRMVRALAECPVPTIAAVDGGAVGLGMDLALACDMRFIGPSGFLQQGWARAGLIPGTGGAALLHRLNPAVGWKLLAEQPRLDADSCVQLALGEAAPSSALEAAGERARLLAGIDPEVLAAYVTLVRPLGRPSHEHFAACADFQSRFIGSERFRSMTAALLGDSPAEPSERS